MGVPPGSVAQAGQLVPDAPTVLGHHVGSDELGQQVGGEPVEVEIVGGRAGQRAGVEGQGGVTPALVEPGLLLRGGDRPAWPHPDHGPAPVLDRRRH